MLLRGAIASCLGIGLLAGTAGPGLAVVPVPMVLPGASSGEQTTIGELGSRPGATRLPLQISDQVTGSVDVGTGNLMLSVNGLALPGVNADVPLGAVFNSQSTATTQGDAAQRWTLNLGGTGSLSSIPSGVLYTAGDGYSALFTPVSGSTTAFTAPAGTKADLVKYGDGTYTLTSRTNASVVTFNADGRVKSLADRNGNTTTFTPGTGKITDISGNKGVGGKLAYDSYSGTLATISLTSGSATRSAALFNDGYGNWTRFTDPAGKITTFGYNSGRISAITPPTGGKTLLTYDTTGRVTQIERVNTSAGSPGNSITRITYPTSTQTLVAGPNTDPAVPVASGPRTTYNLSTDGRVTSATDPMGRAQGATYTGDFDTLTATQGTGTTSGTTTNTYGANSGQSITASASQGGAAGQAEYANTAVNTRYLASSSTDDAGNKSLYTYNGAGNALTSSDAMAATATLGYNTNLDGTVVSALAPGNGTNKTLYGYNNLHELTDLTPVTGSSLGARAFTYDAWARPLTATDGRGNTTTYSYDAVGRLIGTSFSDGTPAVAYTYNANGQVLTRVDGSGTTTYGYDQMGRLTSRVNTAGGGTISYAYDKASNLVSTTDTRGTTSYAFDTSGVMTTMTYLYNGTPQTLAVATDDRGRRTDTWLQASADRTTWAAHTHTDYDRTGRVTRVLAEQGTGDASNSNVVDLTYCYSAGSTAPTCPSTTTADRSKIQWVKNNLTGAVTAYTYDKAGRLTKAAITGGSSPTTYLYTYDARGNRLTASGGTGASQNFTANPANQISTAGYTYDGAGNLTADPNGSYGYNGAEQMTSVTKAGTTYNYTYAGASQNEVLSQTTPNGTYKVIYGRTDAQGQPIIEQYKKDNATAYVEHDPVTGEALMLRTSSGMQSLYVYDGTGNPAALITSASYRAFAYDYDPYGVPTITADSGGLGTSQNPYMFKAGIQDRVTGWVKYGQRWYSPTLGRWTQQDTLDAPLNPKNANRYAFAGCDAINHSDPTGRSVCDGLTAAAAGIGVFAAGLFGLSVLADLSIIALPEGVALGALSGAAGAVAGLTGGAAFVACAAGW
ncbi:RHS repeat domain-containing protein [Arthrobacter humicola]|uniref:RHS repeat domain-containing protein n=1 Tax=Arthrobacter humicola TaxID=409291 RepID=UPI001FAD5AD2|nr:RHS repeat-associated core domain-containing protein [Arthrobacter humicola]MCI9872814.1 RHS repeat-associated core domain-containing protein [Arthrobacter humicola]